MPKCQYCDRLISKQDADICPYCGASHPIDPNYKTQNITQVMLSKKDEELYHSKSKKVAVLLSCLLGPFGAAFFYLKETKKAVISLITALLSIGGCAVLSVFVWKYAVIFPIVILYAFHIAYGIYIAKSHVFKDGEGEYLR